MQRYYGRRPQPGVAPKDPPMPNEMPPLRAPHRAPRLPMGAILLGAAALGACGEEAVAPASAPTQEVSTDYLSIPVQTYGGIEATEGVKRARKDVDPNNTEWLTEAIHEAAKKELHEFMQKVASPARNEEINLHATQQFTGTTAWRPSKLELTFDDGTLKSERGVEFSDETFGRERLEGVSDELLSHFGWSAKEREEQGIELHFKTKIYTTTRSKEYEDRVTTESLVILDGPHKSGGSLLIEMNWNIEWLVRGIGQSSGLTTQLRAIHLDSYTETRNLGEPLFAEVTGHLFDDVPRFEEEFQIGTSAYHHHIDLMDENIFAGQIGIAVGDVDEDGLEDLFIPQQGGHPNRLLKHMPDGSLKDISDGSGLNLLEGCQSALILDFDNDGHADIAMARHNLLVLGYGDGSGKFELIKPVSAGLDKIKSIAAADWDQDGDLDIYTCMYSKEGPLGTIPVPYQDAVNGPPNVAWRNSPDKQRARERWTNVTAELGLDQNNNKFSYGASFEDFDADGDLDLYVVNDFGSNNYYQNDGGHFSDRAHELGIADIAAGMGVSVGDVDGDGDIDIYVTNMWSSAGRRITSQEDQFMVNRSEERKQQLVRHARGNTLFLNDGKGGFEDATLASGSMNSGWAWGAMLVDLNNNGLLDIYSPNGFITGKDSKDL